MKSLVVIAAGIGAAALLGGATGAEALTVLNGSGFCKGTSISVKATVTADRDGNVKVKWTGKGFAPGATLTCHVDCTVDGTAPAPVACGPADDKGKLKATLVYPSDPGPMLICIGMVPRVVIDSDGTGCGLGFYD